MFKFKPNTAHRQANSGFTKGHYKLNQALSQWQTTLSIIMMVVCDSAGGLTIPGGGGRS
jgi:hypothetical protein